jgi:hypothetical protein
MNANLDKIAQDLYGKIQTRFPDIKIGDENAAVLSKKTDIPKARFFEFDYKEDGKSIGTIAITLDDDDGIVVQISGDLAEKKHPGAFKFIRSFRNFARLHLLHYDVQNIGKSNLDKRDYYFQAKHKEQPMNPIMENKMYGTNKISYQDLGEARLVIKHSQPVNTELAAGRTMHIESIYVENADGERFKYPFKHLGGARALAEHLKHGGNPYDGIGKHITSLSAELAQLRKFKGYVTRNDALSEAMGDITNKVFERIESVKKEVLGLSRKAYYESFAESFAESESQEIPETTMNDWIDRLTIRTFNEDLKTAFPYIFKLVGESDIPVKNLSPEDMLSELSKSKLRDYIPKNVDDQIERGTSASFKSGAAGDKYNTADETHKDRMRSKGLKSAALRLADPEYGNKNEEVVSELGSNTLRNYIQKGAYDAASKKFDAGSNMVRSVRVNKDMDYDVFADPANKKASKRLAGVHTAAHKLAKKSPEDQFEEFMEDIADEGDTEMMGGHDSLFSPNVSVQQAAVEKLNQILQTELKGGPEGINAIQSLKGIIDDPEFLHSLKDLDPDLDARPLIQQYILHNAPEVSAQIHFGSGETGGEEVPPEAAAPEVPPEAAAPEVPPEAAALAGVAPAPGEELGAAPAAVPPAPTAPVAESALLRAIRHAQRAGAQLDTPLDFGYCVMTIAEALDGAGIDHEQAGFGSGNPLEEMWKTVEGFINKEEQNFTIGGTRAKIMILKGFKEGQFPGARPEHVKAILSKIESLDPSNSVHQAPDQDHERMRHLAGVSHPYVMESTQKSDMQRILTLIGK